MTRHLFAVPANVIPLPRRADCGHVGTPIRVLTAKHASTVCPGCALAAAHETACRLEFDPTGGDAA